MSPVKELEWSQVLCTFRCSIAWREVYSCHPLLIDEAPHLWSVVSSARSHILRKGSQRLQSPRFSSYTCSLLQTDFPKSSLGSFSKHRVVVPIPGFYHSPQCLWSGSAWGQGYLEDGSGAGCPDPRALEILASLQHVGFQL